MTDKQINAAIAKACGWKPKEETNGVPWLWIRTNANSIVESIIEPLPYCTDLNVMHQAEETLPDGDLWTMKYNLPLQGGLEFRSTARQRAEAFLRTLGKWEK